MSDNGLLTTDCSEFLVPIIVTGFNSSEELLNTIHYAWGNYITMISPKDPNIKKIKPVSNLRVSLVKNNQLSSQSCINNLENKITFILELATNTPPKFVDYLYKILKDPNRMLI